MTAPAPDAAPAPPHGSLARLWEGLRPLDPVRSIKMKFALLVGSSTLLSSVLTWYAIELLRWPLRWVILAPVVITLTLAQLLAHGMTQPLRQLTAAARALAAGRPAPPVRATSRDEVGELARALGVMSRELATADEQRRELLGNVGHELRTPVAALRAQLENLADGVRPADPAALAEVLDQVERLGDLVTDLLDLARAEGGAVPLDRRPVAVRELVQDVVGQVSVARPGRRMTVRVSPTLTVQADPHRLRQVVTNLVDNAARHVPAGGAVEVRAETAADGGFALEVTDDGPGIPPERWETVFKRFRGHTGELPITREGAAGPAVARGPSLDGGTGMGLAIARWAVGLHGGRIAVVPSETGGCRIRVTLPPGGVPSAGGPTRV